MTALRLVFAGTPVFGVSALDALSHHPLLSLQAVYTQPDRPWGRGQHVQPSPVKQWAEAHQVPVYQPPNFKSPEAIQAFQALQPDLLVVIAYGLILPKAILAIPRLGCLNVHTSLLPLYRGAAPIQGALLAGAKETGITLMQMDEGMDTGPIYQQVKLSIDPADTAGSLHDKLVQASVPALIGVIEALAAGTAVLTPQDQSKATYTHKIQKEDAQIDWSLPAVEIERKIRAYSPWPVAFTQSSSGRLRLWQAHVEPALCTGQPGEIMAVEAAGMLVATGEGCLRVQAFQFAGGKVLPVSAWLHARSPHLQVGECLH